MLRIHRHTNTRKLSRTSETGIAIRVRIIGPLFHIMTRRRVNKALVCVCPRISDLMNSGIFTTSMERNGIDVANGKCVRFLHIWLYAVMLLEFNSGPSKREREIHSVAESFAIFATLSFAFVWTTVRLSAPWSEILTHTRAQFWYKWVAQAWHSKVGFNRPNVHFLVSVFRDFARFFLRWFDVVVYCFGFSSFSSQTKVLSKQKRARGNFNTCPFVMRKCAVTKKMLHA